MLSRTPVGESPTGTGGSPVPPSGFGSGPEKSSLTRPLPRQPQNAPQRAQHRCQLQRKQHDQCRPVPLRPLAQRRPRPALLLWRRQSRRSLRPHQDAVRTDLEPHLHNHIQVARLCLDRPGTELPVHPVGHPEIRGSLIMSPIISDFWGSATVSVAPVGVPPTESFGRNRSTCRMSLQAYRS